MPLVHVNDIGHIALLGGRVAHDEDANAEVGEKPMGMPLGGPTECQETDRHRSHSKSIAGRRYSGGPRRVASSSLSRLDM